MRRVDGVGLLLVEARRVRVDVDDVKRANHLVEREHIAVGAEAPSEKCQIIQQPFWNEPAVAVVKEVALWVALRELFVAIAHHKRKVPELRNESCDARFIHRVIERDLAWGRREQVFAAKYVGDSHECIVNRVHERVERLTVWSHDYEVRKASSRKSNFAAN